MLGAVDPEPALTSGDLNGGEQYALGNWLAGHQEGMDSAVFDARYAKLGKHHQRDVDTLSPTPCLPQPAPEERATAEWPVDQHKQRAPWDSSPRSHQPTRQAQGALGVDRPTARTGDGFGTFDLTVDLVVDPDPADWQWTDEDECAHVRRLGIVTEHQAVAAARDQALAVLEERSDQPSHASLDVTGLPRGVPGRPCRR